MIYYSVFNHKKNMILIHKKNLVKFNNLRLKNYNKFLKGSYADKF